MYINPSSNEFIQLTQVMNDFLLAEETPQLAALAKRTPPKMRDALAIVVERFRDYQAEHGEAEFAGQLDARLQEWHQLIAPRVPTRGINYDTYVEVEPQPLVPAQHDALSAAHHADVAHNQEQANQKQDITDKASATFDDSQPNESLAKVVEAFINAKNLIEKKQVVLSEPDWLLSEAADKFLARWVEQEQLKGNLKMARRIKPQRALLASCRREGVELAFQILGGSFYFNIANSSDERKRIISERPELLSDAADRFFADLDLFIDDVESARMFRRARVWLTLCRCYEIDTVLALWTFVETADWEEKKDFVFKNKDRLLTKEANQILLDLLEHYKADADLTRVFKFDHILLAHCRKQGIYLPFAILSLVEAGTLQERKRIVEAQPDLLLTEMAAQSLTDLLKHYQGDADRPFYKIAFLLSGCRRQGIDVTFAIWHLLMAKSWEERKHLIETERDLLLSDAADQALVDWLEEFKEDVNLTRHIKAFRAILASCRHEGLEMTFEMTESIYKDKDHSAPSWVESDLLKQLRDQIDMPSPVKSHRALSAFYRSEGMEPILQMREALQAFANAESWAEIKPALLSISELLRSESGDKFFEALLEQFKDDVKVTRQLELDRAWWANFHRYGAERIFMLLDFIWAENSPESQRIFLANREFLLSDVADQIFSDLLEQFEQFRDNKKLIRRIKSARALLACCHRQEIDIDVALALWQFLWIDTLQESQRFVEAQRDLLFSESASQLLVDLLEQVRKDTDFTLVFKFKRSLIVSSRRQGIDVTFAVWGFFSADTREEKERFAEAQRDLLLSESADEVLADLQEQFQNDREIIRSIEEDRVLLSRYQHEGIDAVFSPTFDTSIAISDDLPPLLKEIERLKKPSEMPRRITLYQEALALVERDTLPEIWAGLQLELGDSLLQNPLGDRANNLEQSIHHYEQALDVFEAPSYEWITTQNHLAMTYVQRIRGERADNIEQAIFHANEVLKMKIRETFPFQWGRTIMALANAYLDRVHGSQADNIEEAISHYQQVLLVLTRQAKPIEWAHTMMALGKAYRIRIRGERADNIEQAIDYTQQALLVLTRHTLPTEWARLQNNLAVTHMERIRGEQASNIEQAISYYQQARLVLTRQAFPNEWTQITNSLAGAYLQRIRGSRAENIEQSILHLNEVLQVRRRETRPFEWAQIQTNLAIAYSWRIRGKRVLNLEQAISYAKQALLVFTREALPAKWAELQCSLAGIHVQSLGGEQVNRAEEVIYHAKQALLIFTRQTHPFMWAGTHRNLAIAYWRRIRGERAKNLEQSIFHTKQALNVYTRQAVPLEWAKSMMGLANAYRERIIGERPANIEQAIAANQGALEIFTLEAMPNQHGIMQRSLAELYFKERRWAEALSAYVAAQVAADLLYQANATTEARQLELRGVGDLPAHTAYCLAKLGRFSEAVETLERGKARALAEALTRQDAMLKNVREEDQVAFREASERIRALEAEARGNEVSMLEFSRPELYQYFDGLNAFSASPRTRDFLLISADLQQARAEFATIVARIRDDVKRAGMPMPEFMPEGLDFSAIKSVANRLNQPLVYLLTISHGTLALIVPPNQREQEKKTCSVEAVWLDDFFQDDLYNILYGQEGKERYLRGAVGGNTKLLEAVLDEIWPQLDKLMQPIATRLSELGHQRAVLIPMDTLTLLPLHAISHDSLIFALAPSARALQSARTRVKTRATLSPVLLGIGNPSADKQKPLAFARLEVEEIAPLFANKQTFYEAQATRTAALTALPGATHLHFSCHGTFDTLRPLKSCLYLADDDTLILRDLLDGEIDLSAARLAVLSACQTGITDFQNVPDEAIGFPAGFLQAGVPGVISTLWPVADISTALLLARFYRHHLQDGLEPAIALHKAQKWLREVPVGEIVSYLKTCYQRTKSRNKAELFKQMNHYRYRAQQDSNERPFAHPYYWAAFTFTGL